MFESSLRENFLNARPLDRLLNFFLPKPSIIDVQQSIKNQTNVSTKLATHLLSKKLDTNVVFSPLLIHAVLNVAAAGSKGETLNQILGFLKSNSVDELNLLSSKHVSSILADGSQKGGPVLSFANGVWVEKTLSLKPTFQRVLESVHKAACKQVDFKNKASEVVSEVNSWAEKKTNGLFKEILPATAFDSDTRLTFANALYFKGTWKELFDPSRTKESCFHLLDGNKVQVPFMTNSERQLVCEYDDFKVLGLPYKQGLDKRQFTMYFFLPQTNTGLPSLLEKISTTPSFIDNHIPQEKVSVGRFLIPKFKISFGFEVSKILKELGLVLPFSSGNRFPEMIHYNGEGLNVSRIDHKSFVEVNEEGTEAAAVSTMILASCAPMMSRPMDFVADHPFLFVIREDVSGAVLFIGQVVNPLAGETGD